MVIVYGGSFNPPTIAHIEIARHLIEKYNPSWFIFVPVGDRYQKTDLAPFHHRKRMLELAVSGLTRIVISDFENKSDFKGTIELLEHVHQEYEEDVYFVLGADNLLGIDQWIRYEELVKNYRFIVFPRDGIDLVERIDSHPILSRYRNHFLIEHDFPAIHVSASRYRYDGDDSVVIKEVNDYIYRYQLYKRGV